MTSVAHPSDTPSMAARDDAGGMAGDATLRTSAMLDRLVARERGWLDLTLLRFVTDPRFPALFPTYLVGVYHAMGAAVDLMAVARERSVALAGHCPVAARLVPYWTRHIAEETGHDAWLLDDLRGPLGVDTTRALAAPPPPEIAELIGTQLFLVRRVHPVAAVAYFHVVERDVAPTRMVDWLADSAGVPRDALRTLHRHAVIDVAHGRELAALVDDLPLTDAHRTLLATTTTTVVRQLARVIEGVVARAGPPA
jgi:hypothetical protein